jgi:hypothetical protein
MLGTRHDILFLKLNLFFLLLRHSRKVRAQIFMELTTQATSQLLYLDKLFQYLRDTVLINKNVNISWKWQIVQKIAQNKTQNC